MVVHRLHWLFEYMSYSDIFDQLVDCGNFVCSCKDTMHFESSITDIVLVSEQAGEFVIISAITCWFVIDSECHHTIRHLSCAQVMSLCKWISIVYSAANDEIPSTMESSRNTCLLRAVYRYETQSFWVAADLRTSWKGLIWLADILSIIKRVAIVDFRVNGRGSNSLQ